MGVRGRARSCPLASDFAEGEGDAGRGNVRYLPLLSGGRVGCRALEMRRGQPHGGSSPSASVAYGATTYGPSVLMDRRAVFVVGVRMGVSTLHVGLFPCRAQVVAVQPEEGRDLVHFISLARHAGGDVSLRLL